ncbi:MAG: hypothetical protein LCH63_13850 [Candidatus Melainabacteria bacterium]|nr:hypothetical protein [Candidatus Melainabacteria bacterium]
MFKSVTLDNLDRYAGRRTKAKGQSSVELVAGLIILVPIILCLFDLAVIVIGVQINDATCREAARVASIGDPTDCNKRAQAIVARANAQGSSMLSNFQLQSCTSTISPAQITAMKANFGGPVSGTVSVVTQVDIKPFVVHYAYSGGAPLTFQARQTYPFTYVVPNTAGGP